MLLVGCAAADGRADRVVKLATTTSTDNSGLLDQLLPVFEEQSGIEVDVIVVGTGQALKLGEAGDVDVILVHARSREEGFLAEGHATARLDVMYNDFVLVGPAADPAGIRDFSSAVDSLQAIALAGEAGSTTFASRGDDSGTHIKEQSLWVESGLEAEPDAGWFKSLGQGMGDTLRFAAETGAYTMTDRGTFLSLSDSLNRLEILVGGASIAANTDSTLYNPYSILPVNPDKGGINHADAVELAEWMTGREAQEIINSYGMAEFGQPLFYPNGAGWPQE